MSTKAGFLRYKRADGLIRPEEERVKDFREFHLPLPAPKRREQAGRCMNCGVPFCQNGEMIAGMVSGCPLHNLVPEINSLSAQGRLEEAYRRLTVYHSFPEFTSRVCPALCEAACTCGVHDEPAGTKENEKEIIEFAYAHDLVRSGRPKVRTGKRVAVVGSGPAGLAAADLLNRRGHEVTVYERKDRIGGLLRYGIPNMKLDKSVIDRRIRLMEEAGIRFVTGVDVGKKLPASELTDQYDSVILACGASNPRDIHVPGRDAEGIFYAVDFLGMVTKRLLDTDFREYPDELVRGREVIVIGGGDTGNDCVGTCIRLGAKSVTQLEMMPQPPKERLASNPWPEWPRILKVDYGQEEAIWKYGADPRIYQTTVKEFRKDKKGHLKEAVLIRLEPQKDEKTGRLKMVPVEGSEKKMKCSLVLIAAGFLGSERYVTDSFAVAMDARENVKTQAGRFLTSRKGVYTAGDMHRGQSLVVWAIAEGRSAAKEVDEALMGYSNL